MQTDLLRLLEKYHFLRLEDIKDTVLDSISYDSENGKRDLEKQDYQEAKELLKEIKKVYRKHRRGIMEYRSFLVAHFEWMHAKDQEKIRIGEKYPDGSDFYFEYKINELIKLVEDEEIKAFANYQNDIESVPSNKEQKIKMPEIAVKIALEGRDKDWTEIAKDFGYTSPLSGRRLLNLYYTYATSRKRLETDGLSNTKIKNRIKVFEKAIHLIENEEYKTKLEMEIQTLKRSIIK